MTGKISPSHGLSRSFSEIIRGNLSSAREYNENSILIFLFFLVQLILRALAIFILIHNFLKIKSLLISDIIISVFLFLYCFHRLIFYLAFLLDTIV
jgi:hypothetical protein